MFFISPRSYRIRVHSMGGGASVGSWYKLPATRLIGSLERCDLLAARATAAGSASASRATQRLLACNSPVTIPALGAAITNWRRFKYT